MGVPRSVHGGAGELRRRAEGVADPGLRLLLLLPAFGGAEVPEVAERLLDHGLWGGPTWAVRGRSPLSGTAAAPSPRALCDGEYSPRSGPAGPGITDDQERALADALAGGRRADQPVAAR